MLNWLHRERGQDLVEYAVILPVLLMLLFGIVELALIFFSYNTINDAAREGARWGVIRQRAWDDTAGIQAAVNDVIVAARLRCTPLTITPSRPTEDTLRVEVTCRRNPIIPITGLPGITLRAVSTKRIELE